MSILKLVFLSFVCFGLVHGEEVRHNGHHCIHDTIADATRHLYADSVRQQNEDVQELPIEMTDGPSRKLLTAGPIRLVIDTSRLYSDPSAGSTPVSCTYVGQVIKFTEQDREYACTSEYGRLIAAWFTGFSDILTTSKRDYLVDVVLKAAEEFFEASLSLPQMTSNLVLPTGWGCSTTHFMCCSGYMPASDTTTGRANTDYILYVTARPTQGNTIAWALACARDGSNDRPVAGHANFGPARLDTAPKVRRQQIATAIHEICHALGFSSSSFGYFHFPDGGGLRGYSNVVRSFTERGRSDVKKMVTPTVIEKAAEHFQCVDWVNEGLELEDGGGSGTASSHWEKRVVMNEFMTGTASSNPVITAMTLAAFADSGWYEVDYGRTEMLPWGYHEGCSFVNGVCSDWGSRYFCEENLGAGCTPDHYSRAYCNLITHQSILPSYFQYFSDSKFGGMDSYADYCPTYKAHSTGDCRDSDTFTRWYYGETVGPKSRCLMGNHVMQNSLIDLEMHSSCHEIECRGTGSSRYVEIKLDGGVTVTCPPEGGETNVVGYETGSKIICPAGSVICANFGFCPSDCSLAGYCRTDGTCDCHPGRTGDDCSQLTCPLVDDKECNDQGTCNRNTGECQCNSAYGESDCSRELCPTDGSSGTECSGHGTCSDGVCQCFTDPYTMEPLWNPPACDTKPCPKGSNGTAFVQCSQNGTCHNGIGACTCDFVVYTDPSKPKDHGDLYTGKACDGVMVSVLPDARYTQVPVLVDELNVGVFFLGADANQNTVLVNGSKLVHLPEGSEDYKISKTLAAGETAYFVIDIDSSDYDVKIDIIGRKEVGLAKLPDKFYVYAKRIDSAWEEPPSPSNRNWISTNNNTNEQGFWLCGEAGDFTDPTRVCRTPDIHFSPGTVRVAVLAMSDEVQFNISALRDSCAVLKCSQGVTCASGKCNCPSQWSGRTCDIPDCPGQPDCSGLGLCIVKNNAPFCQCTYPDLFHGTACNLTNSWISDSLLLDYPKAGGTAELSKTGTVDIGRMFLARVNIPRSTSVIGGVAVKSPVALHLSVTKSDPRADMLVFMAKEQMPTADNNVLVSATDWTSMSTTHQLLLDSYNGMGDGTWFIVITNTAYARAQLAFDLKITVTDACPPLLNNCNNQGVCTVQSPDHRTFPTCICNDTWTGPSCKTDLNSIVPGALYSFSGVKPGDYVDFQIKVDLNSTGIKEMELVLNNTGNAAAALVMLLQMDNQPTIPARLVTDGGRGGEVWHDFDAWNSRSAIQKIILPTPKLKGGVYFFSVYNRVQSPATAQFQIRASLATTKTSICVNDTDCGGSGRGSCKVNADSSLNTCQCNPIWRGTRCNIPPIGTRQQLQTAINNITFLCNMCEYNVTMKSAEFKIYKIPQPLQKATGLQINVTSSNETGAIAYLYVTNVLPRSGFDFAYVNASNTAFKSILLTEQSASGRYYVVILATSDGDFRLSTARLELPREKVPSSSFLEEVWEWMQDRPSMMIALVVLFGFMCCGCCFSLSRSRAARDRLMGKVRDVGSALSQRLSFRRQPAASGSRSGGITMSQINPIPDVVPAPTAPTWGGGEGYEEGEEEYDEYIEEEDYGNDDGGYGHQFEQEEMPPIYAGGASGFGAPQIGQVVVPPSWDRPGDVHLKYGQPPS